jgi:cell division protein FtsL
MNINWQNVFYITASLAMIVIFIASIWLMWLFFNVSKLINNLKTTVHKWSNIVDDVKYLKEEIKLRVSKFLLKILEKNSEGK